MWEHTLLVSFIFVQSGTGAKTIGHKSLTRFKLEPNPMMFDDKYHEGITCLY